MSVTRIIAKNHGAARVVVIVALLAPLAAEAEEWWVARARVTNPASPHSRSTPTPRASRSSTAVTRRGKRGARTPSERSRGTRARRTPARRRVSTPTATATPTPTRTSTLTPTPTRSSTPTPTRARSPRATPVVTAADIEALRGRLRPPIAGLAASAIQDTFAESRGEHRHEATDIVAARGTPVLAVDDGVLAKLFTSVQGGFTVYEFSADGAWCYYYAHLDRYAPNLHEGAALHAGDVVGYVGTTGNARETPHLHFAIFKLGPERIWWEGTPIDPYPLLRAALAR